MIEEIIIIILRGFKASIIATSPLYLLKFEKVIIKKYNIEQIIKISVLYNNFRLMLILSKTGLFDL